ncbi:DUF6683 family protein [Yoonia sp. 2307UL14-13]|uniref:DUF6683 family protein n=1 Tax=Yoonia sp. 2307UL14-13 TaxID=3126506 RepID=UPI0030951D52
MKKALIAVCAFCMSTLASAQDFYMPPLMGGDVAVGLAAQSHIQRSEENRAQADTAAVDLTFSSSAARTQQNLQDFIARTPDPAAKADLQQLVAAQPDIIDLIGNAIRSYGLDPHNVADAYSVWWINSWLVSQMRGDDVGRATVQAVRDQARAALADIPGFSQTSDSERQAFAEALLLNAAILDGAFEQSKNDPAALQQLAQAASRGAMNTGIDLSLMTLTQDGFVMR